MCRDNDDSNKLTAKLLTIEELFGETGADYTIPIYQRNFAWDPEQIEQLMIDINDAIQGNTDSYFLGNVIVTRRNDKLTYEVIDGQQRLTTLYLILAYLDKHRTNKKKIYQNNLRYDSRPRATETITKIAIDNYSIVSSTQDTNTDDPGIYQGYNVIQQFIKQNIKNMNLLDRFAIFLLEKVTVVRVSLPSKIDFNQYFEIMNTRGQQLQQVDIVKARLMSHLNSDDSRACFSWVWDACALMDSYVQMTLTPENTDLRTAIFGNNWSHLSAKNFDELLNHFKKTAGGLSSKTRHTGRSLTITEAISYYDSLNISKKTEDQDNERFRSIISFPSFLLHVLKVWRKEQGESDGLLDDNDIVHHFTRFFDKKNHEEDVKEFAFKLLQCRNIFDTYVIKRQYTATYIDEGDWSLQLLIRGRNNGFYYKNTFSVSQNEEEDGIIDSASNNLLMLQSMLRVTYTSSRTMHWITRILKLIDTIETDNQADKETELINKLVDYSRNKVKEAFFSEDQEPQGFNINRIVFTYLDYLIWKDDKKLKSWKERKEFRFSFRNSIEHFYPQNPDEEQAGAKVSPENLNILGNLALVSVGSNSKFGNNLPLSKAATYKDTIVKQSPKLLRMANITIKENSWGDNEVLKHHKEVVKLLKDDIYPSSDGSSSDRGGKG